jgi:hypothetical protein
MGKCGMKPNTRRMYLQAFLAFVVYLGSLEDDPQKDNSFNEARSR